MDSDYDMVHFLIRRPLVLLLLSLSSIQASINPRPWFSVLVTLTALGVTLVIEDVVGVQGWETRDP